jgi:hypothetical protein
VAKTNWRDALESAKASKRLDCGHVAPLSLGPWFFNADSRLGEAWTVCEKCAADSLKDARQPTYEYRPDVDKAPWTKHYLD